LPLAHVGHAIGASLELPDDPRRRCLVAELRLLAVNLDQRGDEGPRPGPPVALDLCELDVDRPVLFLDEALDLALAIDDQPNRNGLDPTGREAALADLPAQ